MTGDILYDIDGDLLLKDGDIVVGDSTYQHVQDLLLSHKGTWKFDPTAGIDAEYFINDELGTDAMLRLIRLGLEGDGFKINVLNFSNDENLKIDGEYTS